MEEQNLLQESEFSPEKDLYPMCIVWTPLPVLSWIVPCVGHLGIGSSNGVISDFAGPYTIHKHRHKTVFGPVAKYVRVHAVDFVGGGVEGETPLVSWNKAVAKADKDFEGKMHNLITQNCHSHVAQVLNELRYKGFTHWNTFTLILYLVAKGKFVNGKRFLWTYTGFFVMIVLVTLIVLLTTGVMF